MARLRQIASGGGSRAQRSTKATRSGRPGKEAGNQRGGLLRLTRELVRLGRWAESSISRDADERLCDLCVHTLHALERERQKSASSQ